MSIGKVLGEMTREITRVHKQADENKRLTVNNPLNMGRISRQTIAAGSVNVTRPFVGVIPESGTSDNLDEITNLSDGKMVVISPADLGDTITVRDYTVSGTGNISLTDGTSIALATQEDSITLVYREVIDLWIQVGGGGSGSVATPLAHALTHQHGGSDEVATATPGANAIPKAGAGGTLATGWYDVGAAIDGSAERVSLSLTDKFGLAVSGVLNWASYQTLRDTIKSYYDSVVATLTNKNIDGLSNTITNIGTSSLTNDAVTFAKMQNIATDRLIGRDTAGSGDPEEISLGVSLEFSGSQSIQRAALTGDVTASANSNATTIADDAVTFAKMQNIDTDRLIGRDTAGTGDPEQISLGASLEFSGTGSIQRAALTGDVTATANSNATTIANNAVTNTKAADMAQATVKGRQSGAGTGDPEDLTATQLAVILDTLSAYIKANGTVPLTAHWDAGAFNIQLNAIQARSGASVQIRTDDNLIRWQLLDDGDIVRFSETAAGGAVNDHFKDIVREAGDITRFQTITIQLVSNQVVTVWNTYIDILLARNGNAVVYGWATGHVVWQDQNTAIPAVIMEYDLSTNSSGSTTVTVTAINNGIEIELGNGDFLNTVNRNSISVRTYGYDATRPAVTITIG